MFTPLCAIPVSYTHLDVYKRQMLVRLGALHCFAVLRITQLCATRTFDCTDFILLFFVCYDLYSTCDWPRR